MGLCASTEESLTSVTKSMTVHDETSLKSPNCQRIFPSVMIEPTSQSYHNALTLQRNASWTAIQKIDTSRQLTLSDAQKCAMARFWRETIATDVRDIFHRTMLFCIEASPKLNEIIACGRYCFLDLTKWPKLNRICQAQFTFFERVIIEWECDEGRVREASLQLGAKHAQYATYGMKPHFFDIYHQQFIGLIQKSIRNVPSSEREAIVDGFSTLTGFIIEAMNTGQTLRLPCSTC